MTRRGSLSTHGVCRSGIQRMTQTKLLDLYDNKVKRYGRKVIKSCGFDAQSVLGNVAYNRVFHFKVRDRHILYNILIGSNLRSLLIHS